MKRMRGRSSYGAAARILAIGAAAAATLVAPVRAQDRSDSGGCRCVDSAGKQIENCTCLRHFSPRSMAVVMASPDDHARLGISVSSRQSAEDDAKGARVQSVLEDGPAEKAGLREGDIVTRVAGKSLLEPLSGNEEKGIDLDQSVPVQRLLAIVKDLEPDSTVAVTYLRDGKAHTTTVHTADLSGRMSYRVWGDSALSSRMEELRSRMGRLSDTLRMLGPRLRAFRFGEPGGGELRIYGDSVTAPRALIGTWTPDSTRHAFALKLNPVDDANRCPAGDRDGMALFGDDCVGGLRLVALNAGLGSYFGTDKGVLVSDVRDDSPIGLQAGDVILKIGSRDATSPDQVRRILSSYTSSETITFRILRKGKTMDVSGRRAAG